MTQTHWVCSTYLGLLLPLWNLVARVTDVSLKLASVESVMPSNHLILCHPLLLPPSVFPSIRIFSDESVLHIRWPKYWSFSFSISPPNEYSGLISFMMGYKKICWTFKYYSLKTCIVWFNFYKTFGHVCKLICIQTYLGRWPSEYK